MKKFDYVVPSTVEDAVASLQSSNNAKVISGGQTLLPTLKHRLSSPDLLVDITRIPGFSDIQLADGCLKIGGLATHTAVAESELVKKHIPALAYLASGIADPMVRNMGTLGGSVANNDPAADYPSAVLALNATLKTSLRVIKADDFFLGMYETALQLNEILLEISFPIPKSAGYKKIPHPASGYVLSGAFVACFDDETRVAINGAAPCVFRHAEAELALSQDLAEHVIDGLVIDYSTFTNDLYGTPEYKGALVKKALKDAVVMARNIL
jgi:carbon-monoxide dehydrogenase medium subunit